MSDTGDYSFSQDAHRRPLPHDLAQRIDEACAYAIERQAYELFEPLARPSGGELDNAMKEKREAALRLARIIRRVLETLDLPRLGMSETENR